MDQPTARAVAPRPARAALVGASDRRLKELLTDVLDDLGVELRVAPQAIASPDIVVVVLDRDDTDRVITDARKLAGRAPLMAIVPLGDPLRARKAMAAGADATFELDAPLGRLRVKLLRLLGGNIGEMDNAHRTVKTSFQLGPRARAAVSVIRKNRSARTTESGALPEDTESRLEQAIELDLYLERLRAYGGASHTQRAAAFTFGSHATVEMMMLRLSSFEASLIEKAIAADLSRQR